MQYIPIIKNSTLEDIPQILKFYRLAQEHQLKTFPDNLWPDFPLEMIENEIAKKKQWKLEIEGEIACIWAIGFKDPHIWKERDKDPAIYLHRIATHPKYRGQHFVSKIAAWAKPYASDLNKQFIRMDTCGNNTKLIEYYQESGFDFLGQEQLPKIDQLPSHYHDALVCYFEIKL